MKILILTQYYPPETGAPQNRLHELGVRLVANGMDVTVLTAMPNYPQMKVYEGYRGKWFSRDRVGGIPVYRSFIYTTAKRSVIPRLLNYFSFVFSSFIRGLFIPGRFDYILCESPPLFLGFSAVWLSRIKGVPLIFNVSDLWPESAEKLGIVTNKRMLSLAYKLERWCYLNSILVSGQTQGIVKDISNRFPKVRTYWLPNGVDMSAYDPALFGKGWKQRNGFSENDIIFLYAGIIGHAQGLETIMKCALLLKSMPNLHFVLLGEGPEKTKLLEMKKELGLENVHFFAGVPKESMGEVLSSADAAIIPLKKLDIFKGAIPSKIFETLAMEKPVFLGVDGEARELFITRGEAGWYFEPENHEHLASLIVQLHNNRQEMVQRGKKGREYVNRHFNRDNIAGAFREQLKNLTQA